MVCEVRLLTTEKKKKMLKNIPKPTAIVKLQKIKYKNSKKH